MSVLLPMALSFAGSVATKKLFGGKRPGVPDMVTPAMNRLNTQYDKARAGYMQDAEATNDMFEADDAAAGRTGSSTGGRRMKLFQTLGRGLTDLESDRASTVADAQTNLENQQKMMEYQDELGQWETKQQGLADLVSGAGQAYTLNKLTGGPSVGEEATGLFRGAKNLFKGAMPAPSVMEGSTGYPRLGGPAKSDPRLQYHPGLLLGRFSR